ncbi:esterase-like activity of phytase family protein [Pseudomonas indica]|uniref:Uncharacterized conserved protein n=1 Tax=Pseudomonas indica TaxID=137658 RepID=A0A1G9GXM0_9PSED|nr:esterase-like activity of phytase family protein [Pseudomonas indica]SDL05421.1 Uncharacterized conserved protein [Pseudomonas indica]
MARYIQVAAPLLAASLLASTPTLADSQSADIHLRYIGQHVIPTGTLFDGIEFGGISGIDRVEDGSRYGSYYAISDDRGGERGTPRFYQLSLEYDGNGFYGATLYRQVFMKRPDGTPFPADARTVDPEGIRVAPNGNLYWSSEGNWNADPALRHQPFIREMRPDGRFVREFRTPAMFDYVDNATWGARSNKVFEALAVAPRGPFWRPGHASHLLFTANEDALIQDGELTSLEAGSRVRVTALDPLTADARAQYAYELPPIPKAPTEAPGFMDNGLPELLALSDREFIALERGFASGPGNTLRLALASTECATDVLRLPSLVDARYVPMRKRYLLDFDELKAQYGLTLDNAEGLSWGHRLANGNRTLIVVADNNFSTAQATQFIAFEVIATPRQGKPGRRCRPYPER